MNLFRALDPSTRALAVAAAASVLAHGVLLVGFDLHVAEPVSLDEPAYTATLQPEAVTVASTAQAPAGAAAPRPRARPKPRNVPRPEETIAMLPSAEAAAPEAVEEPGPAAPEAPEGNAGTPAAAPAEPAAPAPEVVALAKPPEPALPAAPALPAFQPEALPAKVTIAYALTSAFADGQAEYTWKREGDRYEITGTAEASGFFTLFLEGRIEQESTGRVTAEGLRPEKFTERRGSTPLEGLTFDWDAHTVQFRRGSETKTGPLTDSTVDWLSMIFQLAHRPPQEKKMELRVFTQRRLYSYTLEVLGEESLELPFGPARTLHLRHTGEKPIDTVDVWLGIEQHYLPVKLRYPVARNRLVVEQTATSVTAR